MEDKKKIEAVLFATGDKISVEEISKLTKLDIEAVKKLLKELQQDYKQKDSPFIIIEEGDNWKLTVGEEYMPIVQKIVPHTELSKTIMETLAVIAWKAPVLQSDIIRLRTNKAYDHIKELLDMGFIIKQKHGRSYMIKLAQKFFDYFDLKDKKDVQEKFKEFRDISEADVVLEELEEKGIETYGEEKLGKLEVVEEPEKEIKEEDEGEKLGKLELFEEEEEKPRIEIYDEIEEKPKTVYDQPVEKIESKKIKQKPQQEKPAESIDEWTDKNLFEELEPKPKEIEPEKGEKLKKKIKDVEELGEEMSEEMKQIR